MGEKNRFNHRPRNTKAECWYRKRWLASGVPGVQLGWERKYVRDVIISNLKVDGRLHCPGRGRKQIFGDAGEMDAVIGAQRKEAVKV